MPSFKSCLTSLAFMAFTLAPVISAKGHGKGAAIMARDAHPVARSVGSPVAGLEKRVSSQKRSAAKSAAKKRAIARRAAKAVANAAPKTNDPYAPGSVFQSSTVALSAQQHKCSQNKNCADITTIPNSFAVCFQRHCSLRCATGFAPGGTDGQECVAGAATCPNEPTCPSPPANGFVSCNDGGFCQFGCPSAQGLSLAQNTATGEFSCISTSTDASNCGSANNVCTASYNGLGTPQCRASTCGLRCPAGTHQYGTESVDQPFLCK